MNKARDPHGCSKSAHAWGDMAMRIRFLWSGMLTRTVNVKKLVPSHACVSKCLVGAGCTIPCARAEMKRFCLEDHFDLGGRL